MQAGRAHIGPGILLSATCTGQLISLYRCGEGSRVLMVDAERINQNSILLLSSDGGAIPFRPFYRGGDHAIEDGWLVPN
jgi:hypothetical protein